MTDLINLLQQAAANTERLAFKATGIKPRHLQIIRIVADNPGIRSADLMRAAGLDRGVASWFFKTLLKDGLLRDKVAENDARQRQFWPTPKAIRRIAAAAAPFKDLEMLIANECRSSVTQFSATLQDIGRIGGDDGES